MRIIDTENPLFVFPARVADIGEAIEATERMTRGEAIRFGATRYFNGYPCQHGHISERLTSNGVCIACDSERTRIHSKINREWAAAKSRRARARRASERLLCREVTT